MSNTIPIFPLGGVLFPSGFISLRIFEPRYLDLVRDCTRDNSGFGVCLLLEGREAGEPAVPAVIGTLAHITDFYTLPDGLLGISAEGHRRFEVNATRVRDNAALSADVTFWDDEPVVSVPTEYSLLATILERLHESSGGPFALAHRASYDDSSWVGFRLAEMLPLTGPERQELLQMTDPLERLARLLKEIPRFQRE